MPSPTSRSASVALVWLAAAALAGTNAGCGSVPVSALPPAAEPAQSPPPRQTPSGRVTAADDGSRRAGPEARAGSQDSAVLAGGRLRAVIDARARRLDLYDVDTGERRQSTPAGVGPTNLVSEARLDWLYVVDTAGNGLLVFEIRPRLALVRRVHLPGSPYAIAVDDVRHRLWVTMTARNVVAELPAHGRPHVLRELPTVRQPDAIAVDEGTGEVKITSRRAGVVQRIDP